MKMQFKTIFNWKRVLTAALVCAGAGVAVGTLAPTIATPISLAVASGMTIWAAAKLVKSKHVTPNDPFAAYKNDRSSRPLANRRQPLPGPVVLPSTDPTETVDELLAKEMDITANIVPGDVHIRKKMPTPIVAAGIVSTVAIPVVPSNSCHSAVSAIVTRQLKPQPIHMNTGSVGLVQRCFDYLREFHDSFCPSYNIDNPVVPIDYSEWKEKFSLALQLGYDRAALSNNAGPSPRINLRDPFVKIEGLAKSDTNGVAKLEPRLILAAQREHNVLTGPFCAAMGKAMRTFMHPGNEYGFVYTSGLDAECVGRYFSDSLKEPGVVCYEGDYSRYDSSIHSGLLRIEIEFYRAVGCPEDTLRAFERSIDTCGIDKFGNSFQVDGTRHSGDANTSCGNTLLQYVCSTFCLALQLESEGKLPPPHEVFSTFRVRGLVLGDDSLISLSSLVDRHKYVQDLKSLGLNLELVVHEGVHKQFDATFCSSRFYPVSDTMGNPTTVLAPPIGRVLAKAGYYTTPPPLMNINRLVRGDALSRLQSSHCVPFLNDYWRKTIALTSNVEAYYSKDLRRRHLHENPLSGKYAPNDATWTMLEHCYGLRREHLEVFRAELEKIKALPYVLDMAIFSRAFSADKVTPDTNEELPSTPLVEIVVDGRDGQQVTLPAFRKECENLGTTLFAKGCRQEHVDFNNNYMDDLSRN